MGAEPVLEPILATTHFISSIRKERAPAWCTSMSMLLVDVLSLSAIYWIAVLGRRLITPGNVHFYVEVFPGIIFFVLAFAIHGLYPGVLLHPAEEIRRVFHCITIVLLLVLCTTFFWHNAQSYSRSVVLVMWMLGAPSILLIRKLGRYILSRYDWWGIPAVVFGSGASATRVVDALTNRQLGVRVTAVISDNFVPSNFRGSTHYAILAEPPQSKGALHHLIQDQCRGYRHVLLLPGLDGICSLGISARDLGGEMGFEVPQRLFHKSAGMVKRGLDLLITLPALVAFVPVFLLVAIIIKLTSEGPVFFGHTRYGRNGRQFKALKFRTMFLDSESILLEHFHKHAEELGEWQNNQKLKRDPRVTPFGQWLRRTSLDELPQLCNVFVGQMSLVGPRPIVSAEISKYGRGYDLYSRVRPGITGLWQVSGRSNTGYRERVALDEYYVRNWSIWLDTYILVRTIRTVVSAEGAY
jgi:Undecaprenyl-phosphate galactose phosphotransferase WbaP